MTWSVWLWESLDKTLQRGSQPPFKYFLLAGSSQEQQEVVIVCCSTAWHCSQAFRRGPAQRERRPSSVSVLGPHKTHRTDCESALGQQTFPGVLHSSFHCISVVRKPSWLSLVTRDTGKCNCSGWVCLTSNQIPFCDIRSVQTNDVTWGLSGPQVHRESLSLEATELHNCSKLTCWPNLIWMPRG